MCCRIRSCCVVNLHQNAQQPAPHLPRTRHRAFFQAKYEQLFGAGGLLSSAAPAAFPPQAFSYENFLWGVATVRSRAHAPLEADALSLVPVADAVGFVLCAVSMTEHELASFFSHVPFVLMLFLSSDPRTPLRCPTAAAPMLNGSSRPQAFSARGSRWWWRHHARSARLEACQRSRFQSQINRSTHTCAPPLCNSVSLLLSFTHRARK